MLLDEFQTCVQINVSQWKFVSASFHELTACAFLSGAAGMCFITPGYILSWLDCNGYVPLYLCSHQEFHLIN